MRTVRRRYLAAAAAAAVIVSTVIVSGSAEAANSGSTRIPIAHSLPSWARAANAVGNLSGSGRVSFNVVLPLRDPAGAAAVADSVSDPRSPNYQHYLAPAEFNARFGATVSQVAKVRAYLRSQGFTVTGVAQGNKWIQANGTVAQVNRAFGVTLRHYRYEGKTLKAPDRAASLPTSINGLVAGIVGLDDSDLLRRPTTARPADPAARPSATHTPNASTPTPQSCSSYWGQHTQTVPTAYGKTSYPTYICGYTPKQLRSAYGVTGTVNTGAGVTVAIIDAYGSATMPADANRYAKQFGDPQFASGQYAQQLFTPFQLQTQCGGSAGWNTEQTLDIEAVHAIAPGAKVLYVGAQDCGSGLDGAMNWVIQNNKANIVSNSWGMAGENGGDAAEAQLFLQAKAEGIGFYFSTGDDGDNNLLNGITPQPDYPSSDPNVTAVGGTSLAIDSTGKYMFETSWGTYRDDIISSAYTQPLPGSFWGGGGGGVSTFEPQPSYQAQVVPLSLATSRGGPAKRVVPDIAAIADPYTGFNIGQTVGTTWTVQPIGGTSLACPVIAGIQALASQGRSMPIGFANPLIYQAPSSAFHDVRPPASQNAMAAPNGTRLVLMGLDTSLTMARNYDTSTGRGTPIVPALIAAEHLSSGVGRPVAPVRPPVLPN